MSRKHILRAFSSGGLITLLSGMYAVVPSGTASAATPPSSSANSGWTYYPVGAAVNGAQVVTVNGDRTADGGCTFHRSGAGSSSTGTHVEIQTGFNNQDCQAQFTTGSAASNPASGSQGQSSESASGSMPITAGNGTDPTGYQDNQWLDPFGIQLNAQEQWVSWSVGYPCVYNASWNVKWSWYSTDGWHKNYSSASTDFNGCSSFGSEADAGFENDVFCGLHYTTTYFGVQGHIIGNSLDGNENGGYSWDFYDSNGGNCTGLLHHGHIDHT